MVYRCSLVWYYNTIPLLLLNNAMRLLSLLKILLLAALLSGCAGRILIPDKDNPLGHVMLVRVNDSEETSSPMAMFRLRQSFDKSRVYRYARVANSIEGSSVFNRAGYIGYARIPDSIPHIEKHDLVTVAAPKATSADYDSNVDVPIVMELVCKHDDEDCLKRHNAPKPGWLRKGRRLADGEVEALQDMKHFSPFYNENHELIRPLPEGPGTG